MNNKIKIEIAIGIILAIALIVGGLLWINGQKKLATTTNNIPVETNKTINNEQSPKADKSQVNNNPPPDSSSQSRGSLVMFNEVGCAGSDLFVLSTTSGKIPVDKGGNYVAEFSSEGAQLVFLADGQNKMCATAVSLPKYKGKVYFDAKSTAKAFIFQTIGILTTEPQEAEGRLAMIEKLNSFPAFYAYVKTNLPKQDIASLKADSNFEKLLEQCIKEAPPH